MKKNKIPELSGLPARGEVGFFYLIVLILCFERCPIILTCRERRKDEYIRKEKIFSLSSNTCFSMAIVYTLLLRGSATDGGT